MTTVLSADVDGAGCGPLVSNVFAAAVILPKHFDLPGLTNSKKLSEKKRGMLAQMIKEQAIAWSIVFADPSEILQLDVLHTTMAVMRRATEGLSVVPDKAWIDGSRVPKDLNVPAEAVAKDDSKIIEIPAALVLARTARDAEVYRLAKCYPQYGFDRHRGYDMVQHSVALKRYGVLPEHRRGFIPVKALLIQGNLFEE